MNAIIIINAHNGRLNRMPNPVPFNSLFFILPLFISASSLSNTPIKTLIPYETINPNHES